MSASTVALLYICCWSPSPPQILQAHTHNTYILQTNAHINTVLMSPSSIRSINIIKPEQCWSFALALARLFCSCSCCSTAHSTNTIQLKQNENECVKMTKMKTSAGEALAHSHARTVFFSGKKRDHINTI